MRLLQRRCDEEDFPLMLDMGEGALLSYGIPGPTVRNRDTSVPYEYRCYSLDVPEPRNIERDRAVGARLKASSSLPPKKLHIAFHQRMRAACLHLSHGNVSLTKSANSLRHVAACSLQVPI